MTWDSNCPLSHPSPNLMFTFCCHCCVPSSGFKMAAPLQGGIFKLQRLIETEESALQFLRDHQCIRRTAPGKTKSNENLNFEIFHKKNNMINMLFSLFYCWLRTSNDLDKGKKWSIISLLALSSAQWMQDVPKSGLIL